MTDVTRTVLVVDDDSMNRLILTSLLEAGGYRAVTATGGTEALAALDEEAVDAVLLDIVMPGVDGVGVLEAVKNSPRHWRVPVIMVSAVDDTGAIVRCLGLGAEDYVTKPFDPALLRARLDACLARRRFGDLEGEYLRLVDEQARELERLHADRPGAGQDDGTETRTRRQRLGVVVVGLTGLHPVASAMEPTEALGHAGVFLDVVARAASRHGATLDRAGPQQVTVLVGISGSGPDPSVTALRLAQDVVEEMEPLAEGWAGRHGGQWVVGAGIATGDAIVGLIGTSPPRLGIIGSVVDDADRRCRAVLELGGGIAVDDNHPVGP